jgi:hypothetical protein
MPSYRRPLLSPSPTRVSTPSLGSFPMEPEFWTQGPDSRDTTCQAWPPPLHAKQRGLVTGKGGL